VPPLFQTSLGPRLLARMPSSTSVSDITLKIDFMDRETELPCGRSISKAFSSNTSSICNCR
jgi:hypothetical protein